MVIFQNNYKYYVINIPLQIKLVLNVLIAFIHKPKYCLSNKIHHLHYNCIQVKIVYNKVYFCITNKIIN